MREPLTARVLTWRATERHACGVEELETLPEDIGECEAQAEAKATDAERLCLGDRGTLERYKALVTDVEQLTKDRAHKQAAIAQLQVRALHCQLHC